MFQLLFLKLSKHTKAPRFHRIQSLTTAKDFRSFSKMMHSTFTMVWTVLDFISLFFLTKHEGGLRVNLLIQTDQDRTGRETVQYVCLLQNIQLLNVNPS